MYYISLLNKKNIIYTYIFNLKTITVFFFKIRAKAIFILSNSKLYDIIKEIWNFYDLEFFFLDYYFYLNLNSNIYLIEWYNFFFNNLNKLTDKTEIDYWFLIWILKNQNYFNFSLMNDYFNLSSLQLNFHLENYYDFKTTLLSIISKKQFFLFFFYDTTLYKTFYKFFEVIFWYKIIFLCFILFFLALFGIIKCNYSSDLLTFLIYLELFLLPIFLVFLLGSFTSINLNIFGNLSALALLVNAAAESVIGCSLLLQNFYIVGHVLWSNLRARR